MSGKHKFFLLTVFCAFSFSGFGQLRFSTDIISGAEQIESYLPLLQDKTVALVANQSSLVGNTHLADTLLSLGIHISKVFCPEHGFRGTADAGAQINNSVDSKTGLPIISLYGKHKKPTLADLDKIDFVLFDIQDVGVRFFTYISTLHYVMEACAENHIPMMVFDRPNPNGYFVDGPVLDTAARSFVGMHTVPIVYGMTIGEYALMINGEHWLPNGITCNISVIPCKNYTHNTLYKLPVKPSPNLTNIKAVLLYPSLGLFEGTVVSVGRGTNSPFQVYGHPQLKKGKFEFKPESKPGATKPLYKGEICHGYDLSALPLEAIVAKRKIDLQYLLKAYHDLNKKVKFFNSFFYRLAGNSILQQQIEEGLSELQIRQSWQADLDKFKVIRKKYLLYPDFY